MRVVRHYAVIDSVTDAKESGIWHETPSLHKCNFKKHRLNFFETLLKLLISGEFKFHQRWMQNG
jgi:hypothetical protein